MKAFLTEPLATPYTRSYWVNSSLLAGVYPGSSNLSEAKAKLKKLLEMGITQFVSLMEPDEKNFKNVPFSSYQEVVSELTTRPLIFQRFSIRDGGIPSVELAQKIADHMHHEIERGEKLYLHCWGGRGRTGTIVCLYLMLIEGLSAQEAKERLAFLIKDKASLFEPTPETPAQHAFLDSIQGSIFIAK
jgi:hypothetical protein